MLNPSLIDENSDYYVIDKPAGYSVEPHPIYPSISDWLNDLYHIYAIKNLDRFGIVHRLDVETSGVLIWAKTVKSLEALKSIWQGRQVKKIYLALVVGETIESGIIEWPIERDGKKDRQRVALLPSAKARFAITDYQQLAVGELKTSKISLIECHPITGRTHQIRVHLNSLDHPIIADKLYGTKLSQQIADAIGLKRHWLHAWKIVLDDREYTSNIPEELTKSLETVGINFTG